ncbi:MAG: glycosyl transferase [Deltaproteobacteria bacterium]|nr:glycosyl transferase [Deltaproteobacteria bacterium]
MSGHSVLARLDRLTDAAPHGRVLSNGRLTTLVTGAGAGFTRWDGLGLTTWNGDRTTDDEGTFVYVRDVDTGSVWSLGAQPVRAPADLYVASATTGCVTFEREDGDLESVLDVAIANDADVELRRVRIGNRGGVARALEITAYLEVALHHPAAHAAHPAFSKLFVETSRDDVETLLARRRPFSPGERVPWMAATLVGPGVPSVESDRARFVGRGRARGHPLAVHTGGALSGTVGAVLEPVFALRRAVVLEPGCSVELGLLVTAANERAVVIENLRGLRSAASWDAILDGASAREEERLRACGVDPTHSELLQDVACASLYGAAARDAPDASGASPGSTLDLARARDYWTSLGLDVTASDDALRSLAAALTQLEPRHAYRPGPPPGAATRPGPTEARAVQAEPPEPLAFWNGHGGFTSAHDEYVIHVRGGGDEAAGLPPLPWINVLSNEGFGALVSETGAGYTWSRNSRENRLTPWSNDPVSDPHGEALYVRDEETGRVWSPCPGPVDSPEPCEVRHGFGYTRFRRRVDGLEHELVIFVEREAPVRIAWLRVENPGPAPRALTVWSYAQLVLGVLPQETRTSVVTGIDEGAASIVARHPASSDFGGSVAFATVVASANVEGVSFTADRAAFLGRNGCVGAPAAVLAGAPLDGRSGAGLDPCAAFRVPLEIGAGETAEVAVLLGEVTELDALRRIVTSLAEPGALAAALDDVRAGWRHTLSAVRVRTPIPELDTLFDGWLAYQTLSCRLWGRSALYQSGGAYGFRDQLQDAYNLVFHRPDLTRAQILLHAAHQLVEGDVLHWWHPPSDRGTRTRIADNRLWLPFVVAGYVDATGDASVLDERAPYLTARALADGEHEAYLRAEPSGESGTVYEHCCRALEVSLATGPHGLPLIGMGDWNDGFNWMGRSGRGESVWLAFFQVHVIDHFAPLAERRGDFERARRYRTHRDAMAAAVERECWDGAWYRRAFFDDGTPLGTAADDEGRIDALAQAWAVISGVALRERAEAALAALDHELIVDEPALIRLVWPPFDHAASEPGYIKGYLPGIRENGGQYTHAALWVVRALAELGHRGRAAELLARLTPIHHTRDRAATAIYRGEPYAVAADLYGVHPHVGRAGWTWYTGSSGWMIRVALESILGLTVEDGATLVLAPRVPDDWPGYTIVWRVEERGTVYEIEVRNPSACAARVLAATADGERVAVVDGVARIPLARDGARHRVQVTLGNE